jgi:hypothetical protein
MVITTSIGWEGGNHMWGEQQGDRVGRGSKANDGRWNYLLYILRRKRRWATRRGDDADTLTQELHAQVSDPTNHSFLSHQPSQLPILPDSIRGVVRRQILIIRVRSFAWSAVGLLCGQNDRFASRPAYQVTASSTDHFAPASQSIVAQVSQSRCSTYSTVTVQG